VICLRRLSVAVLGVALLLSACSKADEEVLRVGDTVFFLSDVKAMYEAGSVEIDDNLRGVLSLLAINEMFTVALEDDFGLVVTDLAVDEKYQSLTAELAFSQITVEEYAGYPGVGDGFLHLLAEFDAMDALVPEAIEAMLLEPEILAAAFEDPSQVTNVCARHILVETEEEAQDVIDRLEDGEDFAVVSDEVSLDIQAAAVGGDLGCGFASGYEAEFAEATLSAEIDEIYGPVETSYGFHVLVVYERSAATEEEYLEDPVASVDPAFSNALFTSWMGVVLQNADVEVAERFGTWTESGVVVGTA